MAPSSFGERFGYALWLFHLRTGKPARYSVVGAKAGRTGEAIGAWLKAAKAPDAHSIRDPTAKYLGVGADWLFDGKGEVPEPDLWARWQAARRRPRPVQATGAKAFEPEPAEKVAGKRNR